MQEVQIFQKSLKKIIERQQRGGEHCKLQCWIIPLILLPCMAFSQPQHNQLPLTKIKWQTFEKLFNLKLKWWPAIGKEQCHKFRNRVGDDLGSFGLKIALLTQKVTSSSHRLCRQSNFSCADHIVEKYYHINLKIWF